MNSTVTIPPGFDWDVDNDGHHLLVGDNKVYVDYQLFDEFLIDYGIASGRDKHGLYIQSYMGDKTTICFSNVIGNMQTEDWFRFYQYQQKKTGNNPRPTPCTGIPGGCNGLRDFQR